MTDIFRGQDPPTDHGSYARGALITAQANELRGDQMQMLLGVAITHALLEVAEQLAGLRDDLKERAT